LEKKKDKKEDKKEEKKEAPKPESSTRSRSRTVGSADSRHHTRQPSAPVLEKPKELKPPPGSADPQTELSKSRAPPRPPPVHPSLSNSQPSVQPSSRGTSQSLQPNEQTQPPNSQSTSNPPPTEPQPPPTQHPTTQPSQETTTSDERPQPPLTKPPLISSDNESLQKAIEANKRALLTLQNQTAYAINSLKAKIEAEERERIKLEHVMREMKRTSIIEQEARKKLEVQNQQLSKEIALLKGKKIDQNGEIDQVYTSRELSDQFKHMSTQLESESRTRQEIQVVVNRLISQVQDLSRRLQQYESDKSQPDFLQPKADSFEG